MPPDRFELAFTTARGEFHWEFARAEFWLDAFIASCQQFQVQGFERTLAGALHGLPERLKPRVEFAFPQTFGPFFERFVVFTFGLGFEEFCTYAFFAQFDTGPERPFSSVRAFHADFVVCFDEQPGPTAVAPFADRFFVFDETFLRVGPG